MSDELFAALRQSVIDGDAVQSATLAQQALDDGVPPLDAIEIGLVPGLSYVGEQFGEGELFLPDMMLAARAMQKALDMLEPELQAQSAQRKVVGRVVMSCPVMLMVTSRGGRGVCARRWMLTLGVFWG